jgi:hypothetical protein
MKVKGRCTGCNTLYSASSAARHLSACPKIAHILQSASSKTGPGYLLKASFVHLPAAYWMFLTIPANGTLELLDHFLRGTWLECCGHLSMFTIEGYRYSSHPYDGDLSMKKRIDKVFTPGLCLDYVYDFGSSTDLEIKVIDKVEKCPDKQVTLLIQNKPPLFECELCPKSAEIICSICGETTCTSCSKRHGCAKKERETYMLMPLVNSPRAGVCGYEGRGD